MWILSACRRYYPKDKDYFLIRLLHGLSYILRELYCRQASLRLIARDKSPVTFPGAGNKACMQSENRGLSLLAVINISRS